MFSANIAAVRCRDFSFWLAFIVMAIAGILVYTTLRGGS